MKFFCPTFFIIIATRFFLVIVMLDILILNAVCASTFTLNKILLLYVSPIMLMTLRMLVGGGLILSYFFLRHTMVSVTKKDIFNIGLLACIGIFLSFVLEFWALQYVDSAKAALLYNTTPFVVAFFSYYYFNERLSFSKIIGFIIGFLGCLPILMVHSNFTATSFFGFLSLPDIVLLGAVVAYGYGWIVMKQLVHNNIPPLFINGLSMLSAGLLGLPCSLIFEFPIHFPHVWPFMGWFLLVVLFGNIIFYNLYGSLLKRYTLTFISFTGFTIPFFTALYSWLLLNEHLTWHFFISFLFVAFGLYLFYKDDLSHGYIQ